jgi:predicted amidohydrolase YtcJ
MNADLVLKNGCVSTVDAIMSVAQAVAVKDGWIVYVGDDTGAEALVGPDTQVIDLAGAMVLPGFIDSHLHMPEGAVLAMYELRLPEGLPVEEYVPAIRAFAETHPDLPSIRGVGWDDSLFNFEGPAKEELDKAVPDRPAAIRSGSLHSLWCNSKAFELAGVTNETAAPPYGIIEKRPQTGEPAGTLHESAQDLVLSKLPDYSVDQYIAAFEDFQRTVTAPWGITTCFEARQMLQHGNVLEALATLEREGRLSLRVRAGLLLDPNELLDVQLGQAVAMRAAYRGPLVQANSVKFFADGSGMSIYLDEPFSAVPPGFPENYRGYPGWDPSALTTAAVEAAKLGFHLHFHAIGDAAVRISLDAIEAAQTALARTDLRPAIAHIFLIDDRDKQRLADLGVVAAMQPVWMQRDPYYHQAYLPTLGQQRCDRLMPLKSLFDRGIVVVSSTDFPIVNPPSPLDGIAVGALRRHPVLGSPDDVWTPPECADVAQMIRSYTANGAFANFVENETGSIEVGKSADMVVLSDNILEAPVEQIGFGWMGTGATRVMKTVFQGRIVYSAD